MKFKKQTEIIIIKISVQQIPGHLVTRDCLGKVENVAEIRRWVATFVKLEHFAKRIFAAFSDGSCHVDDSSLHFTDVSAKVSLVHNAISCPGVRTVNGNVDQGSDALRLSAERRKGAFMSELSR